MDIVLVQPVVALLAGIAILIWPTIINYVIAAATSGLIPGHRTEVRGTRVWRVQAAMRCDTWPCPYRTRAVSPKTDARSTPDKQRATQ